MERRSLPNCSSVCGQIILPIAIGLATWCLLTSQLLGEEIYHRSDQGDRPARTTMKINDQVLRTIRILISSPGDVAEERDRARQVIDSLRRRYVKRFLLKPLLWEELPLQMDTSFQQGIDLVLSKEQGVDIAIFILWSRLGSAVGPLIKKRDGGEYRSGTERELDLMLEARKKSGGERPAVLAYTRHDETCFEERLRGRPTAEKEDLIAQKKLVEQFITHNFTDQDRGHNTRAFHVFDRPVKFSQRLRAHLIELLDSSAGETTETVWDTDKQGPPYLGLNAFQPEHADIFFGREEETLETRFSLRERAKQGCAFLLLTGASGSGKSSLARSGVLPDVVEHELDDQVVGWRSLIVTPAELAPDPIRGLARHLASPDVWPDLRNDDATMTKLVRGFRENPELTIDLALQPAIDQLGTRHHGGVRLLLVIDQMEEIFASHVMTDADRSTFLRLVEALAHCGAVWVLATARSDFFHKIQSEPSLLRLLEGRGPMPVLPPSADSLQRLIEEPARLAGLRFEERGGLSLAHRILRDAVAHAELLPLLEYVLRELYEQSCKTNRCLTFASYEDLGGLEGAVGRQAESAFNSLPGDAQAALPELLPLLVTVDTTNEQAAVRRRARLDELRATTARQHLTDCLIATRFLTTDRQGQQAVASFTHEALLRRWDRIANWISFNREHLRIRSRILAAVTNWEKHQRRKDLLLSAGKPLDEANELIGSQMVLEKPVYEFIEQSRARVQFNTRVRRFAVASLCVLTILSCLAGALAWRARGLASEAQQVAEKQARELTQQVYDNSIAIAEREISQNYDIGKASSLLEGDSCPPKLRGWEWHYLMRLRDGGRVPLEGHATGLWAAEFSPDGSLVATCSIDGTLKLWNAESGDLIRSIDADEMSMFESAMGFVKAVTSKRIPITCLSFSPDGMKIATGSLFPQFSGGVKPDRDSPGLVRIWDVASGKLASSFQDQKGVVLSLTYSPDGQRIASSSINPDNSFVVWDVKTGQVVKRVVGHKSHLHRLRYSPDGLTLAAGETDGIVKLWDSSTFEEIRSIDAHRGPVVGISFLPLDGHRFATAGEDGMIRVWRTDSGEMIHEMEGHSGGACDVRYSPDGSRLASGGFDKTVRLWDAENGKPKITLRGHTELIWNVAFSRDGRRLVSASFDKTARIWDATPRPAAVVAGEFAAAGHRERVNTVASCTGSDYFVSGGWDKTIRVWDARTGKVVSLLEGHQGTVWCVALSPDGSKVASASWDHTAKIWHSHTGKLLLTLEGHTAPVHCIAFSPDGTRVATGAFDGQMKIWNATSGSLIASGDGFIFPVMAVAFSPDGRFVASGGADKNLKIWDAKQGELLQELSGHQASIHGISYSRDGRIASASWDRTVRLWDIGPDGRSPGNSRRSDPDQVLQHADRVNAVAFSPDGKFVVSACEDKTVRIWNAVTRKEVGTPRPHRAVVWSVSFLGDGERLVSASWENPTWIHVWKPGAKY
jgi:WD40 repeat protein